jgi:DNA-directed RNA polymerase subunit alpha
MIHLPKQPKIIKKEGNKALFEIENLYPGYGVTIGNSLRRVLLSSLSGAVITQVKIKGVSHEFSTLPGILEDVISIIMNLKQLRFKIFTDESQKAFLKVKGEKKVKGCDFDVPTQVELVNKDCHIATLTDKSAELEMEIQIEKGMGYSSTEAREKSLKEKSTIGTILVDAFFSPVKKVNYEIENMRVGKRTDYDRLFLEIETDGTITPEQALQEASKILLNHFSIFIDSFIARAIAKGQKEDLSSSPTETTKTKTIIKKKKKIKTKKDEKKQKRKKT